MKHECNTSPTSTVLQQRQAITLEVMEANLRSLNTWRLMFVMLNPKRLSRLLANLPICVIDISWSHLLNSTPAPKFDSPSPQSSLVLLTFSVSLTLLLCYHPSSSSLNSMANQHNLSHSYVPSPFCHFVYFLGKPQP